MHTAPRLSTFRPVRLAALMPLALAASLCQAQSGLSFLPRPALGMTAEGVDLSLLWQSAAAEGQPLNLVAGRNLLPPPGLLRLSQPVGSPFDLPSHRFTFQDYGYIGLQFKDGTRLTLRRLNGGLGLTYRTTF